MRAVVPSPVSDSGSAWPRAQGATRTPGVSVRENLEYSLPFLIGGVLLIAVGLWFGFAHVHPAGARGAFWLLLVGLGITMLGGGLALTYSEPPESTPSPSLSGDYVRIPRSEWLRWQEEGSPPFGRPPEREIPAWQETEPTSTDRPEPSATPSHPPAGPSVPLSAAPTSGVTTSPPPVATSGLANDAELVARVSDELLRAPRDPWNEATVPSPAPSPSQQPAWREDPVQLLEAELASLQREPQAPQVPRGSPVPPRSLERCIGCGSPTTSYSEQVCVMCDRPLCDVCLERSVADGRPSVCPFCSLPERE